MNGEIYSNKEYMAISMPQLYKDIMYIKWEDVNKLINNNKENKNISETIDPKNYENVLNIKNPNTMIMLMEIIKNFLITLWMIMFKEETR
ncbi:hypothetical protein JQ036_04100 [Clostridium botulinum]|nr:hypothetical protein [Clostridium botulinum]